MTSENFESGLEEIREVVRKEKIDICFQEDISPLWEPLGTRDYKLPNRVAVQPLEFADADARGAPTKYTLERYLNYAAGCSGLIWFEACSIDFPKARTHDSMLVISKDNLSKFKKLVQAVKEKSEKSLANHDFSGSAPLILQLSHGGRFRKEKSTESPVIANRVPKEYGGLPEEVGRVITDEELVQLKEAFVEASLLAQEAGFDGVDVKACHGYLLNEILASFNREGRYGGESLEDRSRFLLETIDEVIDETDIGVTSRISAYDGTPYPYGFGVSREKTGYLPDFDATEPVKLLKQMYRSGVDLVNISMGNPYVCPFVSRPFASKEMGGGVEDPLKGVERHFKIVNELKEAVPKMKFIGSGYSWLKNYSLNAASHNIDNKLVDVAGWGRLVIANPDFPCEANEKGMLSSRKVCELCSSCIKLLRSEIRVGCVVHDENARKRYRDLI
jgi:2,4-dienoyl-CoA reductase-like NADH-dependent reductase (Old Yellow Enzyme family)